MKAYYEARARAYDDGWLGERLDAAGGGPQCHGTETLLSGHRVVVFSSR